MLHDAAVAAKEAKITAIDWNKLMLILESNVEVTGDPLWAACGAGMFVV